MRVLYEDRNWRQPQRLSNIELFHIRFTADEREHLNGMRTLDVRTVKAKACYL
jgi:hypothetical protein